MESAATTTTVVVGHPRHTPETPTPVHAKHCPVEEIMAFLGHRWVSLVLWHLSTGTKRFGDLQDHLPGVTSKVLADRLASLEGHGLIARTESSTFPRQVSYRLTARGESLVPILEQIEAWARLSH